MDATSSTITLKKAAPVQRQLGERTLIDATSSTITPKKAVPMRWKPKDARVIAPSLCLTNKCQPGVTVPFPGSFDSLGLEDPFARQCPEREAPLGMRT